MHLYPPEFRRGEVLPAVSDDAEAGQVSQAAVHGGKPRRPHVSGSAHSRPALPHVSEGELIPNTLDREVSKPLLYIIIIILENLL